MTGVNTRAVPEGRARPRDADGGDRPRVDLLTREYPPEVYGGAGEHVDNLAAALREHVELTVRCFGAARRQPGVHAYRPADGESSANPALAAVEVQARIASACGGADLVHSHTWYAQLAGHMAKLVHGIPHVATAHSLEPLRPWKAEALAGGYALSGFCERTGLTGADRVVAVSDAMRADLERCYPELDPARITVVRNGIDTERFRPDRSRDELDRLGVPEGGPLVLGLARLTRQKGLVHLVRAAALLPPAARLVVAACDPETPALGREFAAAVEALRATGRAVHWIDTPLPLRARRQLMTHASVFVCPSVYEPLGIVNLEAMACATPVVAGEVGGIPEVVEDGVTGLLAPLRPQDPPDRFAEALAERVTRLLGDAALAAAMGRAGRAAAHTRHSWRARAGEVDRVYREVLAEAGRE